MDHSALPPGTRFAELEILRVVARGGFGIVYLARDHALDREVAVKEFMPKHLVERTDGDRVTVRLESDIEPFVLALRSFVNEAKLLARFSHPAMLKVYRFWEANGTAYMAMPLLRGPTLKDVRRSMVDGPTEAWLRSVIDPLLDALALLHTEGFYHRDIAPDNVILVDGRLPVLLDFGSARRLVADRSGSLTAVLKPHYAPIEQYAESKQLRQGPWTDLYALGALIVYLLDGEPPPAATARSVHDEMNVQARRHVAGVSAEFLSAVDWALAVRPQERPQSVAQWREALDGGKVGPAVAPAPPSGTALANVDAAHCIGATGAEDVEVFARTGRWHPPHLTRKRRLWPALLAGAGLVVTAALVWPPELLTTMGRSTVRANAVPDPAMPPSIKPMEPLPSSTAFHGTAIPAPSEVVVAAATPAMQKKAAPAPMPQTPTAMAAKSSVATVTARTPPPSPSRPAPRAKPKAIRVASPGPIELCAGRNFFVRPYCVQQQCDEKRFKTHPQCIQLREARTRRDY